MRFHLGLGLALSASIRSARSAATAASLLNVARRMRSRRMLSCVASASSCVADGAPPVATRTTRQTPFERTPSPRGRSAPSRVDERKPRTSRPHPRHRSFSSPSPSPSPSPTPCLRAGRAVERDANGGCASRLSSHASSSRCIDLSSSRWRAYISERRSGSPSRPRPRPHPRPRCPRERRRSRPRWRPAGRQKHRTGDTWATARATFGCTSRGNRRGHTGGS